MNAVLNEFAKITIDLLGPGVALHNMPCAICRNAHAVLDLSTGIFQPCWSCQSLGYKVKRSWLRFMFGGGKPAACTHAARGGEGKG